MEQWRLVGQGQFPLARLVSVNKPSPGRSRQASHTQEKARRLRQLRRQQDKLWKARISAVVTASTARRGSGQ